MIPRRRMKKPYKIPLKKIGDHPKNPTVKSTLRFPPAEVLAKFKLSNKRKKGTKKFKIPFTPV